MPQIEELELPHSIYDKLINAKVFTTEDIMSELIVVGECKLSVLSNEEMVALSKVMQKFDVKARDRRVEFVLGSTMVNSIIEDGVKWQDIVAAAIKSYEQQFGIGERETNPKAITDTGRCACGLERIECMKNFPCKNKP